MRETDQRLLLFTIHYPFSNGETFLEAELSQLSRFFARITIIPMAGEGQPRAVPPNVTISRALWTTGFSRLCFYARGLLTPRTWLLFFAEANRATARERRVHLALFYRILLWAIYRGSLEVHECVQAARASGSNHIAYAYWGQTNALAIPLLAKAGVPCVVRYHSVDLYLNGMETRSYIHKHARYFPWRTEIESASKLSLFISDHGLEYFEKTWPLLQSSFHCVNRLGVRDSGGTPPRNDEELLVVASCSALVPLKRVPLIASFVCELAKERRVIWHHFGDGDDSAVRSALASRPATLSPLLHGWVDNESLKAFYRENHVDLFVNFSTREGIPVSIMEALSFDIPVLATAVGGTPEAVINGESGLLIGIEEPNDPAALASRVMAELPTTGLIGRSHPRLLWERRFNVVTNTNALINLMIGRCMAERCVEVGASNP